jgi:hypothetical protein
MPRCTWESIIKPLVSPLIGYGRGYPPKQAKDPEPPGERRLMATRASDIATSWKPVDWSEVFAEGEARNKEKVTKTEKWLRSPEAWDAFTRPLLDRLYEADPANGCGVRRAAVRS